MAVLIFKGTIESRHRVLGKGNSYYYPSPLGQMRPINKQGRKKDYVFFAHLCVFLSIGNDYYRLFVGLLLWVKILCEHDLYVTSIDLTSHPGPGGGADQSGGGPPYFLCPVVTSRLYPVRSRMSCSFGGQFKYFYCALKINYPK